MKIAFFNNNVYAYASGDPSAVGGAERQQWLLARALAGANWSVTVGVRNLINPGESETIDGVEFYGAARGHVLLAWKQFLTARRPDWWYWRAADHMYGPAVALAKSIHVNTMFSVAFDRDVQPRYALSRRRRWWPLYACGLSWTDRILLQHTGQLAGLPARWQPKAYIVPSIASTPAIVKPHCARGKYVAWVAMLRQPKRPDLLIEIARRLPGIHFVVCGGPSTHRSAPGYSERIVAELRNLPNVEWLGRVPPEKAREIIANAALLLSTSDEEGFPNTFLEAWSSGTPVVSLKVDPDNRIEQKGLGVVSGSIDRACEHIGSLIASPQRRQGIGLLARQYIGESHSEPAVLRAIEQAIHGKRKCGARV